MKWVKGDDMDNDRCLTCNEPMEFLLTTVGEWDDVVDAERWLKCGWFMRFD